MASPYFPCALFERHLGPDIAVRMRRYGFLSFSSRDDGEILSFKIRRNNVRNVELMTQRPQKNYKSHFTLKIKLSTLRDIKRLSPVRDDCLKRHYFLEKNLDLILSLFQYGMNGVELVESPYDLSS